MRFLFHLLWASALCGIGLSYKSVYLFHIALAANIIGWVWYALKTRFEGAATPLGVATEVATNTLVATEVATPSSNFLLYFWLAVPLWFAVEMLYCESKTAALQHLVILSFGVSLILLSVLNLKTIHDFKQIFNITAVVGGINIGIGLLETTGGWRYPIGSLSRCNALFGYPTEFWNGLLTAFHGSLISPSPSLNYESTLTGALARISTIPTGMHWNPNDYALFLLLLFPFFLFSKNKIAHNIGICSIFFLIVMAGARLVFIAMGAATLVAAYKTSKKLLSINKATFFSSAFCLLRLKSRLSLPFFSSAFCLPRLKSRLSLPFFTSFFCLPRLKSRLPILLTLFVLTNGFTLAGKYFWQSNEMAFFYKKEMPPSATQQIATYSVNVRKSLLIEGISTLKNHYGIGIGGGNMSVLLQQKGGIGASHITKLHNFWLELAVEGGLLLALAFALWFALLLKRLYRMLQNNTSETLLYYYAISTFIALIGFVIGGIAPSSLLYYLPMYAFLGWALALTRIARNEYLTN